MFQRIARAFGSAPVGSGPTHRVRLTVEPLEDRAVPALFTAANVAELITHINSANTLPGADAIALTPGATYTLTVADNYVDGGNGLPVVAPGGLTIIGNGATVERSTAAGTPPFRLLEVAAGAALTLQNLTLQGGRAWGYETVAGGGILNRGDLTLSGVTIQNNTAEGVTRGFLFSQFGGPAYGGGIYSTGTLSVTGSVIRNNQAIGGYGGKGHYIYYGYEGGRVFIPGGPGGDGFGGGVYIAEGAATFTDSTVTGNAAVAGRAGNQGASKGHGYGGGIYIAPAAAVTLDAFTLTHVKKNTASTSAPDIYGNVI